MEDSKGYALRMGDGGVPRLGNPALMGCLANKKEER